jgi:hypothetical protein
VNEKDDDLFTNLSSDVTIVTESISAPDTLPVDIGGTNCEDVSGDNLRHFLSEGVSYRSPRMVWSMTMLERPASICGCK